MNIWIYFVFCIYKYICLYMFIFIYIYSYMKNFLLGCNLCRKIGVVVELVSIKF